MNHISHGRGRGRGRGCLPNTQTHSNPWSVSSSIKNEQQSINGKEKSSSSSKMIDMSKYENILGQYESSSSEDELQEEKIISKLTQNFTNFLQDDDGSHDSSMIQDVLQSGGICCLVCIESVKRLNAIWSCTKCFCIFHLQCIQKWAREGIGRQAIKAEGDISELEFTWNCPKCRHEYGQKECPTKYYCFCGKEEDPPFDPWIVPHSCGMKCERRLQPECGHECLLLCHPGPCPPCPQTVKSRCYCGKSNPVLKRCSKKYWSCGMQCGRKLPCGYHRCEELCHDGECPPCSKTSEQNCLCGKKRSIRKCAEKQWNCGQTCNKALSCGHHLCEKECHSGPCGDCPRSGKRSCPCGKTAMELPCTEDVNTCVDTCLKPLTCNLHQCSKKCHFGSCESCLQVITKTCRCGRKTKQVPCSQILTCDSKCTKTRSCGRHPCKRKCCDGNCPPCEQVCNRTLNCRNHKCPSPCHQGLCYPCSESKKVSCFCGENSITTPCGKERNTKPPKCKSLCKIPPNCHHEEREPHRCHFGRCPSCKFTCDKRFDCGHTCPEVCHDQVRDKTAENRNLLRGVNLKKKNNHVFIALLCPPCKIPVQRLCLGEHESREFQCVAVEPFSCNSPCGRQLECENHVCMKKCHFVKDKPADDKAGSNCSKCKELCSKPRPEGCIHDCKRPCHPGDCVKCQAHIRLSCHCKALRLYVKCSEFNEADESTKNIMLSCQVRCSKLIECGHPCSKLCHSGECSSPDVCPDKKKSKCKCGRRKKDLPCQDVTRGEMLVCDDKCQEAIAKKKDAQQRHLEEEKQMKLKAEQEELEKYERKKQGRKRKQREVSVSKEEETFFQKYKFWLVFIVLVTILTAFLINLFLL